MSESIEAINAYFRSGNDVPVTRATIKREEWEAAQAYIEYLEAQLAESNILHEALVDGQMTLTNSLSEIQEKYLELIYAAVRKFPDETRHETALKYIKAAEASTIDAALSQEKADD